MKSRAAKWGDPGVEAALRRSAKRALRIGLETGTPVWVMKRGRLVDLTQEYTLENGRPRRRTGRRREMH